MTQIFGDGAGNKYLGDCRWGNHDINYPTTDWLTSGVTRAVMSSTFNSYLLDTGLRHRNPPGGLWSSSNSFGFCFGANTEDTIDDRYVFHYFNLNTINNSNGGTRITLYNNSGYTETSASSTVNALVTNTINNSVNNADSNRYECEFSGVSDSNSLGLIFFQNGKGTTSKWWYLHYAGVLVDVNTSFNYYSADSITKSFTLTTSFVGTTDLQVGAKHYIANTQKDLLQTGRAAYAVDCSDGQTPGAQWATDMWVYDNNAVLGYPVIGRVPNMLLGVGSYTYLKPVKIQGSVFPDNGSPWYLPVGAFAGKTLLMRCYSSVN